MARPPLFTDETPISDLAAMVRYRPGELGRGRLEGSRPYKAAKALLNAAGLEAGEGMRGRYDRADFAAWFDLHRYDALGSVPPIPGLSRIVDGAQPEPATESVYTPPTVTQAAPSGDDATALASLIQRLAGGAIDASTVRDIVRDEVSRLSGFAPTRVEIVTPESPEPVSAGLQHKAFPDLLRAMSARMANGHRLNIWLPGPAGSGKTQAAENAADALGLSFRFTGAIDSPYALLGFTDANGKTVRTQFREAYEHGGVFLLDDFDASDPSAVLALQAALANGRCAFPDAIVSRHPDCCIIASANTWGHGGGMDYVGTFKQNAAFMSRFVFIPFDYDEALELAISGNESWARRVQSVRAKVRERGIKVMITPRASVNGAALLAAGLDQSTVEIMTLRQGMTDDDWKEVSQ